MTAVSAIAKACSMINNVDLVISFRSTQDTSGKLQIEVEVILFQ